MNKTVAKRKRPTEPSNLLQVMMTQGQAEMLGIVFCECGHPPNNHFDDAPWTCAHCECKEYKQKISLPRTLGLRSR